MNLDKIIKIWVALVNYKNNYRSQKSINYLLKILKTIDSY